MQYVERHSSNHVRGLKDNVLEYFPRAQENGRLIYKEPGLTCSKIERVARDSVDPCSLICDDAVITYLVTVDIKGPILIYKYHKGEGMG